MVSVKQNSQIWRKNAIIYDRMPHCYFNSVDLFKSCDLDCVLCKKLSWVRMTSYIIPNCLVLWLPTGNSLKSEWRMKNYLKKFPLIRFFWKAKGCCCMLDLSIDGWFFTNQAEFEISLSHCSSELRNAVRR